MNPIARLEELRAARKRVSFPHPPDCPDCPNSLTGEQADNRDNRENRENRVGVKAEGGLRTASPAPRQSGQSGQSGGCETESRVADRQRWGLQPGEEIPLASLTPTLRPADVDLLTAHMKRQPPDVWRWIEAQAGRYTQRDTRRPRSDAFLAAALDALLWEWEPILPQPHMASRYDRVQAAVRKLRGLDDAARHFAANTLKPVTDKPSATQ